MPRKSKKMSSSAKTQKPVGSKLFMSKIQPSGGKK